MSVRVRWHRGAWWVFARSTQISAESGRTSRRIGPAPEDEAKAERVAAALRRQLGERDAFVPQTVEQACDDYLDAYGPTLRATTRATYASLAKLELVPHLGAFDLRALREVDLLAYARARMEHVSGHRVHGALRLLRRICTLAVRDGRLDRNPVAEVGSIVRRSVAHSEPEVARVAAWTAREVAALLSLAQQHERAIYPLLATLAYTGMRLGEARALRWEDVDLARGELRVRRRLSMGDLGPPKSGKARSVPIALPLERVLRELTAVRARKFPEEPWVLRGKRGRRPLSEAVIRRAWARLRRDHFPALAIQPLRLHDLRHTWASLALEAGRSVRWVADVLGHADASFTLRTYAHVTERRERDSLDFLPAAPARVADATVGILEHPGAESYQGAKRRKLSRVR